MGLREALSNNSTGFAALRTALRKGEITKVLQESVREIVPGSRMVKQVTPALLAELISDYHAGLGVYELASKHGLHRSTIGQHLTAAGVAMRRTVTEAEQAKARELYLSGAPFHAIGKQLGRDPATVKKMVHQDLAAGPPTAARGNAAAVLSRASRHRRPRMVH